MLMVAAVLACIVLSAPRQCVFNDWLCCRRSSMPPHPVGCWWGDQASIGWSLAYPFLFSLLCWQSRQFWLGLHRSGLNLQISCSDCAQACTWPWCSQALSQRVQQHTLHLQVWKMSVKAMKSSCVTYKVTISPLNSCHAIFASLSWYVWCVCVLLVCLWFCCAAFCPCIVRRVVRALAIVCC